VYTRRFATVLNQQRAQCVVRRSIGHLDVNLLLNVTCFFYKEGSFRGVVNPFVFDSRLNKVKHFICKGPEYKLEGDVHVKNECS